MPKITTHLHLALKLLDKISIKDKNGFLLGNAYPDCMDAGEEEFLSLHYKDSRYSLCDLKKFKEQEEKNDFNLGYYFHLWTDNRIREVDTGDISKYDCIICDIPVILPAVEELKKESFCGRKETAMGNILALESEAVPLIEVPDEKRKRYGQILDVLAEKFVSEIFLK